MKMRNRTKGAICVVGFYILLFATLIIYEQAKSIEHQSAQIKQRDQLIKRLVQP